MSLVSSSTQSVRCYSRCATRLENRGDHPPTETQIDALTESLAASGVEAIWHSAVDSRGLPLFPSKVMPNSHPKASVEGFKTLIERIHAAGIPILSWLPLNLSDGVLRQHPDWRMRWYEIEGCERDEEMDPYYVCINSPYRELLPQFAGEVVAELGFDGIWFDGSTFANHHSHPTYLPGCRCDYCRRAFRKDTGMDLPETIDFDHHTVKQWMCWRYDRLMKLWSMCVTEVKRVRSDAVICFNNYRRRHSNHFGWTSGIPLRRLGFDCIISGELDGFPHQVDFQMKMHQAYECSGGVETWWPLCDHGRLWVPDHESISTIQAGLGAITAGGGISMGMGVDPSLFVRTLKPIQDVVGRRFGAFVGKPVPFTAIWCSQADQDFVGRQDTHEAWDCWHGANELSRHNHFDSAVVFDDHVEDGALSEYAVLLAAGRCMSPAQVESMIKYVDAGGVLVTTCEMGTRDQWGNPCQNLEVDRLLGITSRKKSIGPTTLEIIDPELIQIVGPYVSFTSPHHWCDLESDVTVLANAIDRGRGGGWDGHGQDMPGWPRHPGLWLRNFGRGTVVVTSVDWFTDYLKTPTNLMRQLFGTIVTSIRRPALSVDAPFWITVNTRELEDGSWLVNLHNCPGTMYAYPNPTGYNFTHSVGDVPPVHDISLTVMNRTLNRAEALITGDIIETHGQTVRIPRLELHTAIALRW